ncbi:hypothetical protein EIP86_008372 [Pleurotus ostreatoroseus]|nr:hypothetical protein EIP86_008372 [Pleurotus ostreatoroseus]
MFSKLSALIAIAPLVSALTITTPTNWTSAGPAVIEWTTVSGDPSTWSFELVNPTNFHQTFGIANNVNPSLGSLTLTLPAVPPGDGYSLEAVNITNINQVFASTGDFSIGAEVSTTSSSASSTSASASSLVSGSASTTGASASVTGASNSSGSTTGFGITVSSSGSGSAAAATSGASGSTSGASGSGTSSSAGAAASAFNGSGSSGAMSISSDIASWVSMVFAAAAGAVVAI